MSRVAVAALLLLGACDVDPDSVVEVGDISGIGEPIRAPSRARVGSDFVVKITTAGGGCHSVESTEVDGLDITPYDRRRLGTCVLILVSLEHEATLRFDTPGAHTFRVHALRFDAPVEIAVDVDVDP